MFIVVSYWWMKWIASIVFRMLGSNKIYAAQSFFIFIILREDRFRYNYKLINHEKIHQRQQVELLYVGHWILYLLFYLYHLIRTRSHVVAYEKIPFEREAYTHQSDLTYLNDRPAYAWWKYVWTTPGAEYYRS